MPKPRPNPLRVDPTGTRLQQDAMKREIVRRLRGLQREITRLVAQEDVFGLRLKPLVIGNVFCPTGKGGGVDPTCSPGSRRRSIETHPKYGTMLVNPTAMDAELFLENKISAGTWAKSLKGMQDSDGNWYVWDGSKATHSMVGYDLGLPDEVEGSTATTPRFEIQDGRHVKTVQEHVEHLGMLGIRNPDEIRETLSEAVGLFTRGKGRKSDRLLKGLAKWAKQKGAERVAEYDNPTTNQLTTNAIWEFLTSDQKLQEFTSWLKTQISVTVLAKHLFASEDHWLREYISRTFRSGMTKMFEALKKPALQESLDFYNGTKAQFLESAFGRPVAVERVKLIASRSFNELEAVTDQMATQMQRTLTDGFIKGESPYVIARQLNKDVNDLGIVRAGRIARTECLVGDTVVDAAEVVRAFRRWYEGTVVEIETAAGRKFTCTPNHPMLTQEGWISAGELDKTHRLVRSRFQESEGLFSENPNIKGSPTKISEVFDSLNAIGISKRVSSGQPDFHGDGIDGQIDITSTDRPLLIGQFSAISQPLAHQILTVAGRSSSGFCHSCGRLLGVNKTTCLYCVPYLDSVVGESQDDALAVQFEVSRQCGKGFPSLVSGNQGRDIYIGSELVGNPPGSIGVNSSLFSSSADSCLTEDFPDRFLIRSNEFGDLCLTETGEIEFDDVVDVFFRPFAGHVYNLQTSCGYFNIADGLFSGNTVRAHNEGALETMEAQGMDQVGVAVEWSVSGVGTTYKGNPSPCKLCAPLAGAVLTLKEAHGLLPRHPNCVVGDSKIVTPSPLSVMRAEYTGHIVEIVTAEGRSLSVTENHILLTQRGWVKSKFLTDTDYLLHAPYADGSVFQNPNDYLRVPSISDSFAAFRKSFGVGLETSTNTRPEYFHDDGQFIDSKINIQCLDSLLGSEQEGLRLGKFVERHFMVGDVAIPESLGFSGKGSLSAAFIAAAAAADCCMGISSVADVIFRGSSVPHKVHALLNSSQLDSSFDQSFSNKHPIESKLFGDVVGRDSRFVELDHLLQDLGRYVDFGSGGELRNLFDFDSGSFEFTAEHVRVALKVFSDLGYGFVSGGIEFNGLVKDRIDFTSSRHVTRLPVFDVETKESIYSLNSFLSSNCMCSFVPANVGEKTDEQLRTKQKLDAAVSRSLKAERGKSKRTLDEQRKRSRWMGATKKIGKRRPKSIV